MNDKNTLIMKTPASTFQSRWRECLPLGNGEIGAGISGSIHHERIFFNHTELWTPSVTPELPDVHSLLPSVRKHIQEGAIKKAQNVLPKALKDAGYDPDVCYPLPFGELHISSKVEKGFGKYRRCLNVESSEAQVRWESGGRSFQRNSFICRNENVFVLKESVDSGDLDLEFWFSNLNDLSLDSVDSKNSDFYPFEPTIRVQNDEFHFLNKTKEGTHYGAFIKAIPNTGSIQGKEGKLSVCEASSVILLVGLFYDEDPNLAKSRILGGFGWIFERMRKIYMDAEVYLFLAQLAQIVV